jgi:hypothetical protein
MKVGGELFIGVIQNDFKYLQIINQRNNVMKRAIVTDNNDGTYTFVSSLKLQGTFQERIYHAFPRGLKGRRVLFTIKLLHKCFELLCSLLMPYRLGLCVLRRIYRQDYESLFHVVILSEHHHHHKGRYYHAAYFSDLNIERIDSAINFTWGGGNIVPIASDFTSVRYFLLYI